MTRALLALAVLCAGVATAQDGPRPLTEPERRKALQEGTHVLRRILHDHDFEALGSFDDVTEPRRTLVVALGDLDGLKDLPGGLEKFLRDGGAALLTSDRQTRDRSVRDAIVKLAGVSISADRLRSERPNECYHGQDFCPFVFPLADARPNLFPDWREGIGPIACNVPSMLLFRQAVPGIRILGVLSEHCVFENGGSPRVRPPPLLAGGDVGAGRLLIVADHSIFINEMMLPADTGNVEFTYNLVRWLKDTNRDRVLFLDEGTVQTRLAIPLKSPRITPEEALEILFSRRNQILVEAERIVANMEDDDNAINRKLVEAVERGPTWRGVFLVALLAATVAGALFAVYRVGVRDRFHIDRSVPPLLGAIGERLPSGPLAEQRVDALLALGDVREPLRDLARRWLTRIGLPTPKGPRDPVPAVRAGGWLSWWRWRSRLARVWQLAAGAWDRPITPRSLQRWQRELDELRAGWEKGEWRAGGTG